ncbi:hypothetical protein AVEN_94467-1 [Araneus ventricosus]|uniref:Uncharacterized protein n=1 Tax=Araneus ventricosus TaxID=182803 RepID=A0A4Y2RWD5_ARAVE|nr:hypothetical protein AVEN_94467-1 [Araneus ventricosus]
MQKSLLTCPEKLVSGAGGSTPCTSRDSGTSTNPSPAAPRIRESEESGNDSRKKEQIRHFLERTRKTKEPVRFTECAFGEFYFLTPADDLTGDSRRY